MHAHAKSLMVCTAAFAKHKFKESLTLEISHAIFNFTCIFEFTVACQKYLR